MNYSSNSLLPNFSKNLLIRVGSFIGLLLLFLFFINLLIISIDLSAINYNAYLSKSKNVFFLSFLFGIIATAVVQSSSAISTLAVALVAQQDLQLSYAIPVVIGCNIGTTITPLIFSFAHSGKSGQFKRALKIAFTHNIFKLFTAFLLIILEYNFSFLSYISTTCSHFLQMNALEKQAWMPLFVNDLFKPLSLYIINFLKISWICTIIGFVGMYASIKGFVSLFSVKEGNQQPSYLSQFLFRSPLKQFSFGVLGTALIHSSSASISILQTIANSYKISIKKTYNFILGANIGTTFTALLAAFFANEMALQVAFAHLLFNTIGVCLWGILSFNRNFVFNIAEILAKFFNTYRAFLILYIGVLFFLLPLLLIYIF